MKANRKTKAQRNSGRLAASEDIARDSTELQRAGEALRQSEVRLRKLNRVYAVLSDINQAIVRHREPQALFDQVCRIAVQVGGFRMAWIGLLDESSQIKVVAHAGGADTYFEQAGVTLRGELVDDCPIQNALRSRQRAICNMIRCAAPCQEIAFQLGSRASAAFPLLVSGKIRGTVNFYSGEPDFFDEEEIKLLDELALDISFAIEFAEKEAERQRAEKAIESLARFPSENPNPVLRIERDGTLLYANEASYALLRDWQLEIGKPAPSVLQEAVSDTLTRQIGITLDTEHDQRIISFFVAPVVEAGYSNLYGRDVTERKRAEEALRESEERYRLLVETLPDGVIVHSQGRIVFANPTGATIIGAASPADLIGKPVIEFVHPDYRELALKRIQQSLNDGVTAPLAEEQFVRLDGTPIDVEVAALPITYAGKPAMLTVFDDITERKQAERALRESEERFRSILDNIEDGYFEVDTAGNFTFFNPALVRMLGRPANELMGMNNRLYMTPEGGKAVFQTFNRIFRTGISEQALNWDLVRPDGTLRSIEVSVSLIKAADGSIIGFRGTVRDITERKRAEEMLLESELKFRTIFHRALDGILIADMETRQFLMGNSAICQMLGYTHDELCGIGIDEIHPLEHLPYVVEQFNRQARGEIDLAEDIPVKCKDGSVFYADINSTPVTLSGQTYMMGIFRDITERKRADAQLAEQLDELRRWHKATLGRETRILDLKREVNELMGKAGKPPRYPSAESQDEKEK